MKGLGYVMILLWMLIPINVFAIEGQAPYLKEVVVTDHAITLTTNVEDFSAVAYTINGETVEETFKASVTFDRLQSGVAYTITVNGYGNGNCTESTFILTTTTNDDYLIGYQEDAYDKLVQCATGSTIGNTIAILGVGEAIKEMVVVVEGIGYQIIEAEDNHYGIAYFKNLVKGDTYTYYVIAIDQTNTMTYSEQDTFVF